MELFEIYFEWMNEWMNEPLEVPEAEACITEDVNAYLGLSWKGVNDVMQGESICH